MNIYFKFKKCYSDYEIYLLRKRIKYAILSNKLQFFEQRLNNYDI